MNVQELIDRLELIKDKSKSVILDIDYSEITGAEEIDDDVILYSSAIVGKCKRCGHMVVTEKDCTIDYPFYCAGCEENKYEFEVDLFSNINEFVKDGYNAENEIITEDDINFYKNQNNNEKN